MENITIAVGGANAGVSPAMPYIGERMDSREFTGLCKLQLIAALSRCEFDVLDIPYAVDDPQDMIMQINRNTADGAVLLSLGGFGSRKSFNDVSGCTVKYCGRRSDRVRMFCEDICAKLACIMPSTTAEDSAIWRAVGCPSATVELGYLTCFDDAKRAFDPDFIADAAEHVAMGICEYFSMPYVRRDDATAYPAQTGVSAKRGKKIKILQAMLAANGYPLHVDGVYGQSTERAVREFAANNDIKPDGVTAALRNDFSTPIAHGLPIGSKHAAVLYIQRKLYSKLYKVPRNGTLDSATMSCVKEYLAETESDPPTLSDYGISGEIFKRIVRSGGGRPRLF